jgi:molecular chaperone GrpE
MHKEKHNEEIEKLKAQCEQYLNGWKRALADYENLKKQTAREKEEFAKFANTNLILGLVPVYNNLKISFGHLPEDLKDNNWVKGIEHIKKQMLEVLEFNGVEEIVPKVGEEFNPERHEAVKNSESETENNERPENKIVKVLSDGYKLNGRVFMPAKVVVA